MVPELALRDSVLARLKGDAGVAAICQDRVHDDVPADDVPTHPPYLFASAVSRTRIETDWGPAWALRMRLFAVSTDFDRDEAWSLADAAALALEGAEFGDVGPIRFLDMIRVVAAGDVVEPLNPKAVFVDLTATVVKTA